MKTWCLGKASSVQGLNPGLEARLPADPSGHGLVAAAPVVTAPIRAVECGQDALTSPAVQN